MKKLIQIIVIEVPGYISSVTNFIIEDENDMVHIENKFISKINELSINRLDSETINSAVEDKIFTDRNYVVSIIESTIEIK